MKKKCKNGVWLRANPDIATYLFYSPPCKLKSCLSCARMLRIRHSLRIRQCHHENQELYWYFVTITMRSKHHKNVPEHGNLPFLRHAWSKLRKRANRRFNRLLWVKVYERHKSGVYHLHLIMATNEKMSVRWIKDACWQVGLGYQIKRHELESEHIGYVVKYATKFDEHLKIRVIEYSRNFPKLGDSTPETPINWSFIGNVDIMGFVDYLRQLGADVVILNDIISEDE